MTNKTPVAVALDEHILKWIDSKRETPFGELTRSQVVRAILQKAFDTDL